MAGSSKMCVEARKNVSSRRQWLELHDMPALICRQGCAVGRVGYHVYPIRHSHLRIPVGVQHLGQGAGGIGLELAQLQPGLPGVDSGFVSNQTKESVTLCLEGGE